MSLLIETYLGFLDSGRRVVVLDTETTGLSVAQGDRLVEVACLEVQGGQTGKHFHSRLNPERSVPADAVRIHGLDDAALAKAPKFHQVAEDLLAFIAEDPLIIHNAEFDLGFLNAELVRMGLPRLPAARSLDTVALARALSFERASLDALCGVLRIDTSARELHSALLDCQLLAQVFLSPVFLHRARPETQEALDLSANRRAQSRAQGGTGQGTALQDAGKDTATFPVREFSASPEERAAHKTMVQAKLPKSQWQ